MLKEQQNVPHGVELPSEEPGQQARHQREERQSGLSRAGLPENEMFTLVLKITLRSNFLTCSPDQDGAEYWITMDI